MASRAVREVHADLVARELIAADSTFSFHGLRKNACCYLLELGLSDTEAGSILGMSSEMVRHYGKRARALMIARGAAERVTGGKIVPMAGATALKRRSENG
jgi:integrase